MSKPPQPENFEHKVVVIMNGQMQAYWDRSIAMTGAQREALERFEQKLHQGFEVNGVHYKQPDILHRAQFSASMIPQAVETGDDTKLQILLSLVCSSLPDLKQLVCRTREDGSWDIAFITDRHYAPDDRPIQLMPPAS